MNKSDGIRARFGGGSAAEAGPDSPTSRKRQRAPGSALLLIAVFLFLAILGYVVLHPSHSKSKKDWKPEELGRSSLKEPKRRWPETNEIRLQLAPRPYDHEEPTTWSIYPGSSANSALLDSELDDFEQCKSLCAKARKCLGVAYYPPGSQFRIQHTTNGHCWRPEGTEGQANIHLENCTALDNVWTWEGVSLKHVGSGLCIHPNGGSANPDPETELVLYDGCNEPRLGMEFTRWGMFKHSSGKCVRSDQGKLVLSHKCTRPYRLKGYCMPIKGERQLPEDKSYIRAALKDVIFGTNPETDWRTAVRPNNEDDVAHVNWKKVATPTRDVPNTRPDICDEVPWNFPSTWTASIIMCFRNEPMDRLMVSLKSILFRTSPKLLREIILIDEGTVLDANETLATADRVRQENLPKVQVVRNEKAVGLMRCRMQGADLSKSEVYVFLDSHIEVMEGWLEPMMQAVTVPGVSAVPVCDIVEEVGYKYVRGPAYQRGTTDWTLVFTWEGVPNEEKAKPYEPFISPVMVGGLFAITAARWAETGQYDRAMEVWGGENIEMSFREWMCHGQIYITPCSRMGHVFKKTFRYPLPPGVAQRNQVRTALAWMDGFGRVFRNQSFPEEDVSARLAIRESLRCHNFRWYLDNVNPNMKASLPPQWLWLLDLHPPK